MRVLVSSQLSVASLAVRAIVFIYSFFSVVGNYSTIIE